MSLTVRPWTLAFAALSLFASAAFATAPDLAVTKAGPASANAGTDVTYTIQVTNSGTSATPAVELTDPFPAGTSFVSVTPAAGFTCTTSGSLVCDSSSIAGTSTATFVLVLHIDSSTPLGTISNTATAVMATDDPTPTDDTSTADTTVTTSADLAVTKTGPATVNSGSEITYTITLTNNGPSDAANVTLTDTTPPNTTFNTFAQTSGPAFNCTLPLPGTIGTVTCSTASVIAGQTATFAMDVHVDTVAAGTVITNKASASAATNDPDLSNNSGTASTTATAPDLAVTKAGPASVIAGTNVTYTVTVTNGGNGDASSVHFNDILPAFALFQSETQTSGSNFSCVPPPIGSTGTIACTNAVLGTGQSATFVIVVSVSTQAPNASTFTNTAQVSATNETNTTNNSATTTAVVVNNADLAITKMGPSGALTPNATITYTIAVTNNGPGTAGEVTVTDTLPSSETFVSATPSQGTCSGTTTVTCSLGSLANGGTATISLVARINSGGTVTNTATVTSTSPDTNPANNTASATVTVTTINIPAESRPMLLLLIALLAITGTMIVRR